MATATLACKNEIAEIDKYIWSKYFPDKQIIPCKIEIAEMWLQTDIECVLVANMDKLDDVYEDLIKIIQESRFANEILKNVNLEKAKQGALIRSDFATALRNVKKGYQLSNLLDYGFFKGDIARLAKLHKSNRFRKKIEDLLEDCNFHKECGDFINKNYDKYLK